jgi:hypothetical protein
VPVDLDEPSVKNPTNLATFTWRREQTHVPKRSVLFVEGSKVGKAQQVLSTIKKPDYQLIHFRGRS